MATIAERDGGWFCRYCATPLVDHTTGEGALPLDGGFIAADGFAFAEREHLTPRSRGGTDDLKNLGLACSPCNGRKGALTEPEFLLLLAEEACR
jgi:hypothetical protein